MEELKRPSFKDTEEDLLREQEIFLKTLKGVAIKKDENKIENSTESSAVMNETKSSLEVQHKDVVFDVQERDVSCEKPFTFKAPSVSSFDMSSMNLNCDGSKKLLKKSRKSLFSQMMQERNDTKTFPNFGNSSLIVDGSGLSQKSHAKEIHEENVAKLKLMSEEDILLEQQQLKNQLGSDLVNFIQQRRKLNLMKTSYQSTPTQLQRKQKALASHSDVAEGEILRKEGNPDCDALILQKAAEMEICEEIPSKESSLKLPQKYEIPHEAKQILEQGSKSQWKNMSKVEPEKLQWMTDLAKPAPIDVKTGYTARFDFEGKLIACNTDVPMYQGLHHHGNEPEAPGYSLEELFLLARSTLQSQRITALHTLAHILDNYWYGMLDGCFDAPLLHTMLESGLVPLLRWALDDTSTTSVAATLTAIHSLLINKADEACLQKTYCWLSGHIIPNLEPQGLEEPNFLEAELKDADLIKLDVIKGFLRIDILPRFVYILTSLNPPPLVCKLIIEICTRLAQHSPESAKNVASHPGLLALIFDKFLPLNWQFIDGNSMTDSVDYHCPMASAMKLVHIIISSSKELAYYLIETFNLETNVIVYLTLTPSDGKVPLKDMQSLMIATLKVFHSLLCYGFGVHIFLDLFPIFLKQMEFCLALDLHADRLKHAQDFEYATHFFKMLEGFVISTSNTSKEIPSDPVNAFIKQSVLCLKKWLYQFPKDETTDHGMNLIGACMNFISTFYRKSHKGLVCENYKPCSAAKEIFSKFIIPCIASKTFKSTFAMKNFSLYLNTCKPGNKRDGDTIVSLGSVLWQDDIVPLLKEKSPIPLALSILNFALAYQKLFGDHIEEFVAELMTTELVQDYLQAISFAKFKNSNWFLHFENQFIFMLLQLSSSVDNVHMSNSKLHHIAASFITQLKTPHEILIVHIFEDIIFNEVFLKKHQLFHLLDVQIIQKLPLIAQHYISCFLPQSNIQHSLSIMHGCTDLATLSSASNPTELLSSDWYYLPIFNLYKESLQKETDEVSSNIKESQVICSLYYVHLCHLLEMPFLRSIPAAVEYCYLCMVFLLDEDVFRNDDVQKHLREILKLILKVKQDFSNIKWRNLNAFEDLYVELLFHYESVSYGDSLFGLFVLLPLQQNQSQRWKKLLLTEHAQVLRFLRIQLHELPVPLQSFLEPVETDLEILSQYYKLLISGALTSQRCPLIYLMALHHLHWFLLLRNEDHVKSQKVLLSSIFHSKNVTVRQNIILYSEPNESSVFLLNTSLSKDDHEHLSRILGHSFNL